MQAGELPTQIAWRTHCGIRRWQSAGSIELSSRRHCRLKGLLIQHVDEDAASRPGLPDVVSGNVPLTRSATVFIDRSAMGRDRHRGQSARVEHTNVFHRAPGVLRSGTSVAKSLARRVMQSADGKSSPRTVPGWHTRPIPPSLPACTINNALSAIYNNSAVGREYCSHVFAFTSVLLFGPEAGAVTLALDCLVLAWHRRMGLDKAAFNFGNLTLAVWGSGTLFFAVSGAKPLLHGGQAATLILPLGVRSPFRSRMTAASLAFCRAIPRPRAGSPKTISDYWNSWRPAWRAQ